MFICPNCNKEFKEENKLTKHYLACWKENHSSYKSKSAPRSEDIVTREIDEDILNFFKELK